MSNSIESTYDYMISVINAFKHSKRMQKRPITKSEKMWLFTDDPIPDFLNYEYRIYDETPKPAIVGLFFDGDKYYPEIVTVTAEETANFKVHFDNLIKETVKSNPKFRKWLTDPFYYNT